MLTTRQSKEAQYCRPGAIRAAGRGCSSIVTRGTAERARQLFENIMRQRLGSHRNSAPVLLSFVGREEEGV